MEQCSQTLAQLLIKSSDLCLHNSSLRHEKDTIYFDFLHKVPLFPVNDVMEKTFFTTRPNKLFLQENEQCVQTSQTCEFISWMSEMKKCVFLLGCTEEK